LYLKDQFFEKLKQEYNGLVRPQLEKFLFEEVGITNVKESHRILYKIMMEKLKQKVGNPQVINKAFANEHKVIYKYKDIEEIVIK
jgi:hypothetical protein